MGWNVDIKTSKDVTEEMMDEIAIELSNDCSVVDRGFGSWFGNSKQSWGWSLYADVRLISPRIIGCSGSCSISGKYAEEFCEAMKVRLENRGMKAKIGEISI